MQKIFSTIFLILICKITIAQNDYTRYVNPFIGTGGHGHTYPGATLPHGMVQLSPDTRLDGWDGCSGYHYSDSFIYGFTHTHLSGTGCSDYGDVLLMPGNGIPSSNNKVYGSLFSHKNEKASPGFYSVKLLNNNIDVKLTSTERVGVHQYHFNNAKEKFVILDLKHRDEVISSSIKIEDDYTVSGLRRSKAWANDQHVFFVMKFSAPIFKYGIWLNDSLTKVNMQSISTGKNIKAYFKFDKLFNNDLIIKVAISSVSVAGAKKNLEKEAAHLEFNQILTKAKQKWNEELARIEVKSKNTEKLKVFYTALYHTAIVPNINMDVDSNYRGMDHQIHKANDFDYYSVFSLWDTYRAAHPLYSMIDKKRTLDYVKTFLAQYQQGGRLPVWELASCETDCMIGYHSVPVILDAFQKGITDFDKQLALEAMIKSANWNHLGLPAFNSKGLINVEDEHESISKTLEYAYDDYCIGYFAKLIGQYDTAKYYFNKACYYKNIFDPATGFMRPRKNGNWISPFDPKEVNNHFTEANSWQYSFYFPQDVNGYIDMIGGKDKLENKLDQLFSETSQTTGRDQSDITGLIGQYAHGNEPSHHIAYLYDYTNSQHKTQYMVNKIMNEFYSNQPDGLIGNEDCGQMSAWYVFSSLGFYPVNPSSNKFMLGSPQFDYAKINLDNGNSFVINGKNKNEKNFYIKSVGIKYKNQNEIYNWYNPSIDYSLFEKIDCINIEMDKNPTHCLNQKINEHSISKLLVSNLILNPVIHSDGMSFVDSQQISISSNQKNVNYYYTLDGAMPTHFSKLYNGPFFIDSSVILNAIAIDANGDKSFMTTALFKKLSHVWDIASNTKYMKSYDGGGELGLIDEIHGTTNWRMGNWQGYQNDNLDVVVDIKESKSISEVNISFLQDTRSWVIMPKGVAVEVSNDGKNFTKIYEDSNYVDAKDYEVQIKNVKAKFESQNVRYVRVVAIQYGKLPEWHQGYGGDSIIFVDEIELK
jgi:predicted alpha-1,2-mannosidase